mgnify:CR=1 FL=1
MIKIESPEQFQQETASGLVLVDFYTEWCGPCKKMLPVLEQLSNVKVVKVNVEEQGDISEQFSAYAVPTLVLLKDGKQVAKKVGLQTLDSLQGLINEQVN